VTTVRILRPLQPPRQRRVGAARVRPAHSMNDAGWAMRWRRLVEVRTASSDAVGFARRFAVGWLSRRSSPMEPEVRRLRNGTPGRGRAPLQRRQRWFEGIDSSTRRRLGPAAPLAAGKGLTVSARRARGPRRSSGPSPPLRSAACRP
jgi:hypothetical protein